MAYLIAAAKRRRGRPPGKGKSEYGMAKCHPERRAQRLKDRLCVECLADEHAALRNIVRKMVGPQRIPGVIHHCLSVSPDRCPKCNGFVRESGREVMCINCGATYYMVNEGNP